MAKSNQNVPAIVQEGDSLPQKEYADTLAGLKKQIQESQLRAITSVNRL